MSLITILLIVFILLAAYHYFYAFMIKNKHWWEKGKTTNDILIKTLIPAFILTAGIGFGSYYGVESYLYSNPEIIEKIEEIAEIKKTRSIIKELSLLTENTPQDGDLNGEITVYKFFDYNCRHCRITHSFLKEAAKETGNVRIAYKHMPMYGPISMIPHKAAIAAHIFHGQKKGSKLHDLLMKNNIRPNQEDIKDATEEEIITLIENKVMELAQKAGINTEKLKEQMDAPEVAQEISNAINAAGAFEITGTPTFIFEDKIRRGRIKTEAMIKEIKAAKERN
jgi:protein-disulfide isomerase